VRVTRLLQRLQRRALVVLAWLVLAVAVPAPAPAPNEAPLAALVCSHTAQTAARAAAVTAATPARRREAVAPSARERLASGVASSPRAGAARRRGPLAQAAAQAPARDRRHLYLETLTLLC
jgi:hypothetical protein